LTILGCLPGRLALSLRNLRRQSEICSSRTNGLVQWALNLSSRLSTLTASHRNTRSPILKLWTASLRPELAMARRWRDLSRALRSSSSDVSHSCSGGHPSARVPHRICLSDSLLKVIAPRPSPVENHLPDPIHQRPLISLHEAQILVGTGRGKDLIRPESLAPFSHPD